MRLVMFAVLVLACGGPRARVDTKPAGPPAVARDYAAARWIPAKPTYVLAARSIRDAQRAITDFVDSFGMIVDVDTRQVSAELRKLLVVDPLSPDSVSQMGIDLDGGIAMFSESLHPTFVVHLSAPEQTQAFFDHERTRGMETQSQIVDGAEIFTSKLGAGLYVSWVIDKDWLWVHFTLPFGVDEGTAWLKSSRTPGPPTWTADWEWAQRDGKPQLVGFVDLRGVLAKVSARIPEAVACARLFEPVGRAGFSIEGDGNHAAIRVAVDVGIAAPFIANAILPPPEGWAAVAARAPLAAQWNLDLVALRGWLAPCAKTIDLDLMTIDTFGVRAARVILQTFDPDEKEGTGVVALDITSKRYFAGLLDEIPLRSKFESNQTYGPHAGRRLSIPFGPKVDYVLTDQLALAGVGDGLLGRAVGRGVAANGALLAIDLSPRGLSPETWEFLLRTAQVPHAKRIAERLLGWRDAHLAIRIDGSRLVLEASGSRR